ncbi:hypothetical protein B0T18DRAFT_485710 [Schizothecium vesticola]|uniref:Uncharacterized protein n=1 Tax=Schizothecium vesticola TaxID=314040 RepID=A0AA40KA54_9PEZI|nr:hypothetical protein B0T18DRAFT_485710 [Schizothecium vesticola]
MALGAGISKGLYIYPTLLAFMRLLSSSIGIVRLDEATCSFKKWLRTITFATFHMDGFDTAVRCGDAGEPFLSAKQAIRYKYSEEAAQHVSEKPYQVLKLVSDTNIKFSDTANAAKGIIFLGTPHRGSDMAN